MDLKVGDYCEIISNNGPSNEFDYLIGEHVILTGTTYIPIPNSVNKQFYFITNLKIDDCDLAVYPAALRKINPPSWDDCVWKPKGLKCKPSSPSQISKNRLEPWIIDDSENKE